MSTDLFMEFSNGGLPILKFYFQKFFSTAVYNLYSV